MFTVPPTFQSFGEVVAQKFERPESRALPTFVSAEAGNPTPKTAFRSLELAVPTRSGHTDRLNAAIPIRVSSCVAAGHCANTQPITPRPEPSGVQPFTIMSARIVRLVV